jgi:CRISPR-associated Cas5-like protein
MKALTFEAHFLTAQFKEHLTKLTRRTYLIPPPSVIAGIFGAILGIKRNGLVEISKEILAGAELRSIGGRLITLARLYKIDRPLLSLLKLLKDYYSGNLKEKKAIQELLPIKESEELFMPKYKFAIASTNDTLIEEGIRRLREYDFEYEVFGGNDYHFADFVGNPRTAKIEKSREGFGYCPKEEFEGIEATSFTITYDPTVMDQIKPPIVMPTQFLANVNAEFIEVYGAKIITKSELDVVNDGESKIFVYKAVPFFTSTPPST